MLVGADIRYRNWDRKTMASLRLLGLVERRDIWSLRDLKARHIIWLKHMREKLLDATIKLYPELEKDQLKLYVHCRSNNFHLPLRSRSQHAKVFYSRMIDQPTYYQFHIHVVNVALEAGPTQATGKAFGLENLISQLETLKGGDDAGMSDTSVTYSLGEESELWLQVFQPLKEGKRV